MDVSKMGSHLVTVCPYCDTLISVKSEELGSLTYIVDIHVADNEDCKLYMDNLPTMFDIKGILNNTENA